MILDVRECFLTPRLTLFEHIFDTCPVVYFDNVAVSWSMAYGMLRTVLPDIAAPRAPAALPAAICSRIEEARSWRWKAIRCPPASTTAALSVTRHEGMPQLVWRRALCESEAMPALVTRLQQALAAQGQEVGAPDGKLGRRTMAALVDYQRREGLAAGLITFETLQRLGLAVSER